MNVELEAIPNPPPKTQTFKARFRPNTPLYILIALVIITAGIGTVFVPDKGPTIIGFCGMIAVSLFGLVKANDAAERAAERDIRAAERDAIQADKVEKVAVNLEQRGDRQEKQLTAIHTLVNSQMAKALRIAMDMSEFKAFTTKDPEDIKVAASAKAEYEEHMRQQAIVDGQEAK